MYRLQRRGTSPSGGPTPAMEIEVGLAREPPQSDSGGLRALAACNTRLLAEENSDINLVFSPLAIYSTSNLFLVAGTWSGTLDKSWSSSLAIWHGRGRIQAAVPAPACCAMRSCISASGAMSHARIKQALAFINNLRPGNCHAPSGTR
jgi:hypothetical protein